MCVLHFLARVLTIDGWSNTQNNNNMKPATKTSFSLLTGLLVLLASLTFSNTNASAGITTGSSIQPYTVTGQEINALLSFYGLDNDTKIYNIKIKIFGMNDELIYSAQVCQGIYDCDERLNQMLNQSDFITEVDNTRIYILNQ